MELDRKHDYVNGNVGFDAQVGKQRGSENERGKTQSYNVGYANIQSGHINNGSNAGGAENKTDAGKETDGHGYQSLRYGKELGTDHVYLSFGTNESGMRSGNHETKLKQKTIRQWEKTVQNQRKIMIAIIFICIIVTGFAAYLSHHLSNKSSTKCNDSGTSKLSSGEKTSLGAQNPTTTASTQQTFSTSVGNFTTPASTSHSASTSTTVTSSSMFETSSAGLPIAERCQLYGGVFPDPNECQAYYNCSVNRDVWYSPVPHFVECSYPDLFNTETMSCDFFENVQCNGRREPKDGCEYRYTACGTSHCIPCYIRIPRCSGTESGYNVNNGKLWSPYYVTCYKERLIKENSCPSGQLFSPDFLACVSLDWIPNERGGRMPNCTGKADGFYPDEYGRCDRYTICEKEKYVVFVECGSGYIFDEVLKDCRPIELASYCSCGGNW